MGNITPSWNTGESKPLHDTGLEDDNYWWEALLKRQLANHALAKGII